MEQEREEDLEEEAEYDNWCKVCGPMQTCEMRVKVDPEDPDMVFVTYKCPKCGWSLELYEDKDNWEMDPLPQNSESTEHKCRYCRFARVQSGWKYCPMCGEEQ